MSRIMEYPEAAAVGSGDKLIVDGAAGTRSLSAGNALYRMIDATGNWVLHKSVLRTKNLGSSITSAQVSAITSGTFTDLFVGDYWVINGINWRIIDINYYLNIAYSGLTTTNHLLVMPDKALYTKAWKADGNASGGWNSSDIFNTLDTDANAFVPSDILNHSLPIAQRISNSLSGNGVSSVSRKMDIASLMQLFGYVSEMIYRTDNKRFAIAELNLSWFNNLCDKNNAWTKDLFEAARAYVVSNIMSHVGSVSVTESTCGIRPYLAIAK